MTQEYNIGFPQGIDPYTSKPKQKKSGIGYFGIIGAIIIIIVIILGGYFFIYPSLTPNKIR